MSLTYWLVLCCLALPLVWWVWSNRQYISLYWKVGSPYPALPFIGHGYLYMADREKILQKLYAIGNHAINNGGVSGTWILHRFYLVMADAVDTEFVMKHYLEKDESVGILRIFTRTSSLLAPVSIWRHRRRAVSTLLSVKNVSNFEPAFAKGAQVLVEQLKPLAGKEAFPIWERFNAYTLDVTCTTILGFELKCQTNLEAPLRTAVNGMMELASEIVIKLWYQSNFIRECSNFNKTFKQYDQVIKDHVENALKKHENVALTNNKIDDLDDEEPFSLVHLFSQMKEQLGFDHNMLHDESLGLLMAGTESTAIASSTTCVLLARRPEIQEKLYEELKEVFGDSDRPVTNDDLFRLKYLDAVVKETQRLYTAVPHITRKTFEDFVLPSGLAIPKGTNFIISIYALNRNPKYWGADAEEFRPERFLDGSVPEQAAYFAFSHGPRSCSGIQFAMMVVKTGLASVLRRYRLLPATSPDAPLRFLFGLNVKAVDNFCVRIEERIK